MRYCAYEILPSVTHDGTPTFRLYRDVAIPTPFGLFGGRYFVAENPDRAVLERAIEHLQRRTDVQVHA